MAEIARWTTPIITYKPSAVESDSIAEIYLVIKQGGHTLVTKALEDATITDGRFAWQLTQEETSVLASKRNAIIQIDYKANSGMRYTTVPRQYDISESGINEVI